MTVIFNDVSRNISDTVMKQDACQSGEAHCHKGSVMISQKQNRYVYDIAGDKKRDSH